MDYTDCTDGRNEETCLSVSSVKSVAKCFAVVQDVRPSTPMNVLMVDHALQRRWAFEQETTKATEENKNLAFATFASFCSNRAQARRVFEQKVAKVAKRTNGCSSLPCHCFLLFKSGPNAASLWTGWTGLTG